VSNSQAEGPLPETPRGRSSRRAYGRSGKDLPEFARLFALHADQWIAWIDSEARLLFVNPALCRALGYAAAELSSLRVWDLSPTTPESWPLLWAELKERVAQRFLAELRTKCGRIVPAHVQVKLVTVDGGEYGLCCGHDLRVHAAPESVAPGGEPLALEPGADVIFLLNKGSVVDSNRQGPQLFGCPRQRIIEELEAALRESGRMMSAFRGEEFTLGWESRRPDASPLTIRCTVSRIEIEGRVRFLAVATDATAWGNSERTLAQLSGRLLEMQDEERRRIARELHDTTGQNLAALSINFSLLLSAPGLDPGARETLEESIALTDACVREIRTMSYLLHPPLLDELGLESALRSYSEGYAERTGIGVDLELSPGMPRLPQAIEIALFRIVQEGLANIHRHSGSLTATLRLKHEPDRVELEIADQGCGLPAGILVGDVTSASRIGVGIAGMRERARQLGGRLTIGSSETGTTLHVVLPAAAAKPART